MRSKGEVDARPDPVLWRFFGERKMKCPNTVIGQKVLQVVLQHVRGKGQGLTLVHFSAQLERLVWIGGAFMGCVEGV